MYVNNCYLHVAAKVIRSVVVNFNHSGDNELQVDPGPGLLEEAE